MRFRRSVVAVLLLAGGGLLPGCRSMSARQETGTLLGALVGAGGGYAVGRHNGHRGKGAVAGAAVGAMAGYILAGDSADDGARERARDGDPEPVYVTARERVYETAPRRVIRRRYVVRECECDPVPPGW